MVNEVELIGRMGFTPDLRWTGGGKAVTNVSIAIATGETNAQGQRSAEFIPATLWGSAAESICKHGKKGDVVRVKGNLRMQKKQDADKPVMELHSNEARRMMFGEPRYEEAPDITD